MSLRATYSDGTPVIAYRLATASGEVLAERRPTERFYAASTIKLAPLVAAVRLVESGDLALDDTLISRDTFSSQVPEAPDYRLVPDDVDHGMAPPGDPMPLRDVLERMIVVSSNEATNMVVERVGLEAIAKVLADAGAHESLMARQFGDQVAAREHGASNVVTPADLATLMAAIVSGRLAGPEGTRLMTEMLARQQDPQIAAGAPAGLPWGSKSGSVDAIRHDVAYLGEPGPGALVLAVCTRGYAYDDADEAIQAIGQMAIELTGVDR
ncbi:class A beta-lactamase-related serine hydrolase [Mumia sp. zg.B17]|uniref:serine hydrolase n=1 Tax=unclassified Mumia TaxID=2621872 RepID=UPI001C6F16A2|nr:MULTISPECIES: serine hydrolase [unclassified Mumia]MBW9207931.1 class A beta-lactamase-related serine hydrolase [Mumia sp. zg.B17]MBW9210803.1 class A beta-lactamase-related serine hydrolase [Mumia sp. zg.B21]